MRSCTLTLMLVVVSGGGCAHGPQSRSSTAPAAAVVAVALGRFDHGNPVIVRMAGRNGTLTVASTARGPVYSVVNAVGETTLAAGTLEDLRRVDPQLYRQVRTGIVAADEGTHARGGGGRTDGEGLDYLLIARD